MLGSSLNQDGHLIAPASRRKANPTDEQMSQMIEQMDRQGLKGDERRVNKQAPLNFALRRRQRLAMNFLFGCIWLYLAVPVFGCTWMQQLRSSWMKSADRVDRERGDQRNRRMREKAPCATKPRSLKVSLGNTRLKIEKSPYEDAKMPREWG